MCECGESICAKQLVGEVFHRGEHKERLEVDKWITTRTPWKHATPEFFGPRDLPVASRAMAVRAVLTLGTAKMNFKLAPDESVLEGILSLVVYRNQYKIVRK